ncbi:MAG: hypothetical protein KAT62_13505 [Desulfuromonadales bacterium]|nr:hypothetical protein [Desulfuromonadales bacterium]
MRNISGDEIHYEAKSINKLVDSTGVGDVFFAAYLVHRFLKAKNMVEASKCAAKVAARQIEGKYITSNKLAIKQQAKRGRSTHLTNVHN